MRLELHWPQVETLTAGTATRLAEKTLAVDVDELCALLEADARLLRAHLDLAHPGELISAPQSMETFGKWSPAHKRMVWTSKAHPNVLENDYPFSKRSSHEFFQTQPSIPVATEARFIAPPACKLRLLALGALAAMSHLCPTWLR